MKQPLIFIPPAQAEALYDVSLSEEQRGRRSMKNVGKTHSDDWDDGGPERKEGAMGRSLNGQSPMIQRSQRH